MDQHKPAALDTQVGGNHYKGMAIQPTEFAMTQGYDFCAANILKYVTRHRHKNGRQDIEKAVHYAALRKEIIVKHGLSRFLSVIQSLFSQFGLTWVTDAAMPEQHVNNSIEIYIALNGVSGKEAATLRALHYLVLGRDRFEGELEQRLAFLLRDYED